MVDIDRRPADVDAVLDESVAQRGDEKQGRTVDRQHPNDWRALERDRSAQLEPGVARQPASLD